jgi:outer membrane protein assembly factor BamB
MKRVVTAVAAAAILTFARSAFAAETKSWPAYGRDAQLTNYVSSASITAQTARRLRPVWRAHLDGTVVASPLSARLPIDGSEQQIVYVTTEAGSIYALNAADGDVLWQRTFDTVTTDACGTYGFSSTGAIDVRRGVLYEIGADGLLHALALTTGDEQPDWPLRLIDRIDYEYVWGGLQLIDGRLYVPVASYCDEPGPDGVAAEGRLVAIDPDTMRVVGDFDTVPGYGHLGGIWGWGGVATDPAGSTIYTGVGNSHVYSSDCGCYVDDAGYGDKLVALTPDLSQVLAANKPAAVPSTGDEDFGAAPLVFQPPDCPPLLAAKNKMGVVFVWNRDDIDAGPIASFGLGDGTSPFVGAPSYDAARELLFVSQAVVDTSGPDYGIAAIAVASGCKLRVAWKATLGAGNQPPPLVVGDVVIDAGGSRGGFGALDARTGRTLWTFRTKTPTISPLIEVDGLVIGGSIGGTVFAFAIPDCHGLEPASPKPCPF